MKSIFGIIAVAIISSASMVGAAELESGLKVGDSPGAFYVTDVTGPSAGETLCYRCQYNNQPVVSIFARSMDDNVQNLVKQIDEVVGKRYDDERMAAFVVMLSDKPKGLKQSLVATAKEHKLTHTPLTTFSTAAGPRKYRIHEDAEVTVIMWVDSDVKSNLSFAKGKLNADSIKQVIADTAKILN
jgi:hypothetical protein